MMPCYDGFNTDLGPIPPAVTDPKYDHHWYLIPSLASPRWTTCLTWGTDGDEWGWSLYVEEPERNTVRLTQGQAMAILMDIARLRETVAGAVEGAK